MKKYNRKFAQKLFKQALDVELSQAAQELVSETTQEQWVDENTPLAEVLVFSADPLDVVDFIKKNAA